MPALRSVPRILIVTAALLLFSSPAPAGERKGKDDLPKAEWDPLSKKVIAKILEGTDDFGSSVRVLRKASCTIDVRLEMNVLLHPLEATVSYGWEDANESGTITGNEIQIETESVSDAVMRPLMKELKTALELQTVGSAVSLFPLNDIRTVKVDGGYKMRLQPVADQKVRDALGYEVTYVMVSDDFRPLSIRSKDQAGGESVATPKWTRWHDRWLATGWRRVVKGGTTSSEQERTDEYAEVQGLPLLQHVRIEESITTLTGIVTAKHDYTLHDWVVEKRTRPVPATPGLEPTPGTTPGKDEDEELFKKPPAPTPTPVPPPDAAPQPASRPLAFLGTWDHEIPQVRMTFEFRADGRFARTLVQGEEQTVSGGTWTASAQRLDLRYDSGADVSSFPYAFGPNGRLTITGQGDTRLEFTRRASAPARPEGAPAPAGGAAGPVGSWVRGEGGARVRLVLLADGTYTRAARSETGLDMSAGRWRVEGASLLLTADGSDAPERMTWRLLPDGRLEVVAPGGIPLRFSAEGRPPPSPSPEAPARPGGP